MYKVYLLLLFMACGQSLSWGQSTFSGRALTLQSDFLDESFRQYELFQINAEALNDYVKNAAGLTAFNLKLGSSHNWLIELVPNELRSPDYVLSVNTEQGLEYAPRSETKTFKGRVLMPQGGRVRLTLDVGFIYGFLEIGQETYYIEPVWHLDDGFAEGQYVVYRSSDVIPNPNHRCGTDELHSHDEHQRPIEPAPAMGRSLMNCYEVDLALAADFQLYSVYGSVSGTENFMLGVLNNVQANFDDEFSNQIFFVVAGFFISTCSSCNPWSASTDAGTLLNSFTSWGNAGGFGFPKDLASLWTNRNLNGGTVGVAWLGGLCSSLEYNVLQRFTTNAAQLRVLQAHEFGHNFNAGHDAAGAPFIMAPSVNTSNQWSAASTNTINNFINAKSTVSGCFSNCGSGGGPQPPIADISAPLTHACPGSFVPFIDASQNDPVSWSWNFPGGVPSSSSQPNPVVFYPNPGTFPVSLNVTNAGGSDFTVLQTDIVINTEGPKYLLYETFEDGLGNWQVINPDNNKSWEIKEVGGTLYGKRAAFMDNFNYNRPGELDALISPTLNLAGQTGAALQIDYAYRRFNANRNDQLKIYVSTDGGATFPHLVFAGQEFGGGNFATSPDQTTSFTPSTPAHWCYAGSFGPGCITINLAAFAGLPNVKIRIENVNGYGNGLYIDNVRVSVDCIPLTPPEADFSANVTQGCAPLAVNFLDYSVGVIDSWSWQFPGGNPPASNAIFPTVTYATPGVYSATLVVSNGAGSDTITKVGYITVKGLPQPNFTYTVNGLAASFQDLSANATSRQWDFGDGSALSTVPAPTHTYAAAGDYVVTLTAINECGQVSISQTITVVQPIQAVFSADTLQGCPGLEVNYTDESIGTPIAWYWQFPGGSPGNSTAQNPTVVYNQPGLYQAILAVDNGNGAVDTVVQQNFIQINGNPGAAFDIAYSPGDTAAAFSNVTVNGNSYFWDFGDGDTSTLVNPLHDFPSDGVYAVTLIAYNACGSDTTTQLVEIITAPTAGFGLSASSGCAPFTVQVSDQSSANATAWSWSAPGAEPESSLEQNPSFTYASPGVYTIHLEASNAAGNSLSSLEVSVGGLPSAGFDLQTTLGEMAVQTENTSTDADSYSWDFGDGTTSSAAAPSHSYPGDGVYTITLIAANACGSDTTTQEIAIITAPTAGFGLSASSGCAPFTVQVSDQSSANATAWSWSAPGAEPESSLEQNPSFTYASPGVYTIHLEASNAAGNSLSSLEVSVGGLPSAGFDLQTTLGEMAVQTENTSTDADSYSWDFGDGTTSSAAAPSHSYAGDGVYTITLISANVCGSDTTTQEIAIITAPTAGFGLSASSGCAPFTVQVSDQSSANATAWSWSAPGAEPESSLEQNPSFTYASPGVYTIHLEASNAAGNSLSSLEVSVGGLPQASFGLQAPLGQTAVQTENTSTDANSYSWDFGDGTTSSAAAPSHSYAGDGVYTITLIAANACGSDTTTQEIAIITAPTAGFGLSASSGCAPFTVQVSDQSSANATAWLWSAPGAEPESSLEQNPSFTYASPGVYTIYLEASNAVGNSLSSQEVNVTGPPSAGFDLQTTLGEMAVQTENTSTDADSYFWDFGDGTTSTAVAPEHSYAGDGVYTITLIAIRACGSDTITQQVEIITAPTAGFGLSASSGCAPFTVQVSDQSSANATAWSWSAPGAEPESSLEQNPSFTYANPGVYTIHLEASNAAGNSLSSLEVSVGGPPQAGFNHVVNGVSVQFSNASINSTAAFWDFGDGSSSTSANPTHNYSAPGNYLATLTASNDCGEATVTDTVVISLLAPVANFTATGTQGCLPLTVAFSNQSTNGESYLWAFPGGTPTNSMEENPVVVYETPGVYPVSLTAINPAGSGALTKMDLIVVNGPPVAGFDYAVVEATVSFGNVTTNANSYLWLFGDGQSSTAAAPVHTYPGAGDFSVTLIAANACGVDTIVQVLSIVGQAPLPIIAIADTTGCVPFALIYSANYAGGEPTAWQWAFPGGEPAESTDPNPVVVYNEPGVYSASLTMSNAFGENTAVAEGLVVVEAFPMAEFSAEIAGLSLNITSVAQGDDWTYFWDFGDGNSSTDVTPSHTYAEGGAYTVELTVGNNCGRASAWLEVEAIATSLIDESWLESLRVFPNPNRGQFTIALEGQPANELYLGLLNVIGQRLYEYRDSFHAGVWQHSLNLAHLPAGVYVLEIRAGERRAYRRVVVE
jgi:PKD repeat protein